MTHVYHLYTPNGIFEIESDNEQNAIEAIKYEVELVQKVIEVKLGSNDPIFDKGI